MQTETSPHAVGQDGLRRVASKSAARRGVQIAAAARPLASRTGRSNSPSDTEPESVARLDGPSNLRRSRLRPHSSRSNSPASSNLCAQPAGNVHEVDGPPTIVARPIDADAETPPRRKGVPQAPDASVVTEAGQPARRMSAPVASDESQRERPSRIRGAAQFRNESPRQEGCGDGPLVAVSQPLRRRCAPQGHPAEDVQRQEIRNDGPCLEMTPPVRRGGARQATEESQQPEVGSGRPCLVVAPLVRQRDGAQFPALVESQHLREHSVQPCAAVEPYVRHSGGAQAAVEPRRPEARSSEIGPAIVPPLAFPHLEHVGRAGASDSGQVAQGDQSIELLAEHLVAPSSERLSAQGYWMRGTEAQPNPRKPSGATSERNSAMSMMRSRCDEGHSRSHLDGTINSLCYSSCSVLANGVADVGPQANGVSGAWDFIRVEAELEGRSEFIQAATDKCTPRCDALELVQDENVLAPAPQVNMMPSPFFSRCPGVARPPSKRCRERYDAGLRPLSSPRSDTVKLMECANPPEGYDLAVEVLSDCLDEEPPLETGSPLRVDDKQTVSSELPKYDFASDYLEDEPPRSPRFGSPLLRTPSSSSESGKSEFADVRATTSPTQAITSKLEPDEYDTFAVQVLVDALAGRSTPLHVAPAIDADGAGLLAISPGGSVQGDRPESPVAPLPDPIPDKYDPTVEQVLLAALGGKSAALREDWESLLLCAETSLDAVDDI